MAIGVGLLQSFARLQGCRPSRASLSHPASFTHRHNCIHTSEEAPRRPKRAPREEAPATVRELSALMATTRSHPFDHVLRPPFQKSR